MFEGGFSDALELRMVSLHEATHSIRLCEGQNDGRVVCCQHGSSCRHGYSAVVQNSADVHFFEMGKHVIRPEARDHEPRLGQRMAGEPTRRPHGYVLKLDGRR